MKKLIVLSLFAVLCACCCLGLMFVVGSVDDDMQNSTGNTTIRSDLEGPVL